MPGRWVLPLALFSLTLAGCGPRAATVSGTVTFKKQPLPSGTVLFHGADGRIEHGLLGEGGRYTIADAPPGPVRIAVKAHAAKPAGLPSSGRPPAAGAEVGGPKEQRDGKFVAVPARYGDPALSGLTYTVRGGAQTHDIELTP